MQYAELARALSLERNYQWDRRKVEINISHRLRDELSFWLGLRLALLNGAHWAGSSHIGVILHSHKAHIDACPHRWGGTLVACSKEFRVAEDFNDEEVACHF